MVGGSALRVLIYIADGAEFCALFFVPFVRNWGLASKTYKVASKINIFASK